MRWLVVNAQNAFVEFKTILRFKYPYITVPVVLGMHIGILMFDPYMLPFYVIFGAIIACLSLNRHIKVYLLWILDMLMHPKTVNKHYRDSLVHTRKYMKIQRFKDLNLLKNKLKSAETLFEKAKFLIASASNSPVIAH